MMCNNNKTEDDKLSFLRENFPFLKDYRLNKMYTLMNEGFDINLAIILSFFDIYRGKILILRKKRKEELNKNLADVDDNDRKETILSFATSKYLLEEDKNIYKEYLRKWNKKTCKEGIAIG